MSTLTFHVNGTPGAQGSKRHVGHGRMVESSKKVAPWRQDVKAAAEQALLATDEWDTGHNGPVHVSVTFRFRRPQSHYGTGRNACTLKPSAPAVPTSRAHGDVDKLTRSTLDALVQAGVIADDSLVVALSAFKVWTTGPLVPGATITLSTVSNQREVA